MTDESIINIQENLAHQDQQIQELNEVVTRQWTEIDKLSKKIGQLTEKIESLELTSTDGDSGLSVTELAERQKPPHY